MEPFKVFIVDDEMLIRQGIINYIDWNKEGFQIAGEASNGKEALEIIEKVHPDIIITDIVMPIMNGIEFVKQVKERYSDIEIIILSSFEDFDYVRSTFQYGVADYILKPKLDGDELLNILNKVTERIPQIKGTNNTGTQTNTVDEVISKLLTGYDSIYDETLIASYFSQSEFCLVSVNWKDENDTKIVEDEIIHQLRRQIPNAIIYPIVKDTNSQTLLINIDVNQMNYVKQSIEQLSEQYNSTEYDTKIQFGISVPFHSLQTLKKQFTEHQVVTTQYLFYLPDKKVLIHDELPQTEQDEANKSFDLNEFIELFKQRQFTIAFDRLEDYVTYLSGQYTKDIFEFKSFLGNIVFNVIVLMGNLKYDAAELENEKYTYFTAINDATDVKDALHKFHIFIQAAITIILTKEKDYNRSNMEKLLDYIDEHYAEPLSLNSIAEHFHFNASYLSSYFSSHHKEGISEYLNRIRIKKAQELLQSKGVPISSISEMVGYSDHSYFCKVFKKITGQSPSSYRKAASG